MVAVFDKIKKGVQTEWLADSSQIFQFLGKQLQQADIVFNPLGEPPGGVRQKLCEAREVRSLQDCTEIDVRKTHEWHHISWELRNVKRQVNYIYNKTNPLPCGSFGFRTTHVQKWLPVFSPQLATTNEGQKQYRAKLHLHANPCRFLSIKLPIGAWASLFIKGSG